MGLFSFRMMRFGGFMTLAAVGLAQAQTQQRPPIGGIGSPPDSMIFYVAHGAAGTCGPGCSDWIAAEGTVQWDTHKRLIAILDRQAGRKLPVVIHSWGESNLNVAVSLGRILRDRGIDTMAGPTEVESLLWQIGSRMFRAQTSGRAARCQGKSAGHRALRSRLRADAGRRGASQPAAWYLGNAERDVHPQ